MTISAPKRSHEESTNDMQVDSDAFASQPGSSVFQSINECFGSPRSYYHSSLEAKAQTLALLGSIDFKLEDLESHVLNTSVTPQIFAALEADLTLAEEAATCLKNLMTNEHLGSKCTRRLYALSLFPVLHRIMERLVSSSSVSTSVSTNFIEAIAVQIWCIASTIPAALPQISTSPLAALITKRLAAPVKEEVSADNALLTALLVSLEDNSNLAESLLQLNPMFLAPFSNTNSISLNFDSFHLNLILRLMCFLQLSRSIPSTAPALDHNLLFPLLLKALQTPLPEASLFESDSSAVKLFFECYELTLEAFELLIVDCGPAQGRLLKQLPLQVFYDLPTKFSTYWQVNFRANFDDESNVDRVRLVRRIFSIIGTVFTILEQFIISCNLPRPREINFIAQIESFLQLCETAPSADYGIEDEVSGWLRAWLMSWGDSSDYPQIPAPLFDILIKLFFSSSSPVVLTNTCALVALLIPYAPESIQKDFCVFLNSLLCTDPFDIDHLEVLMAAVDAVTGIFDPQSKEWPAKTLHELKKDVQVAKERLEASLITSQDSKEAVRSIKERIHALSSLYRIL